MTPFVPHPLLHNPHAQTLAASLWPRRTPHLPSAEDRLFTTEPGTQVLARCHWQLAPRDCATIVALHGLEGSSESPYMRGLAEKAFVSGFNVLRLNQRNCGDTERLSPTLYNSGMSADCRAVVVELIERDRLPAVFLVGYSMGGNLALKMAGEFARDVPPQLRGVCGVCPALDLAACVDALERPRNILYDRHFVRGLKARFRRKARLFPERYQCDRLARIRTVRQFDEAITAPLFGYRDSADYYFKASAARVLGAIAVPTLMIIAKDDPFVPFAPFTDPAIAANPCIRLVATERGGHCGFISRTSGWERYWAEARVIAHVMEFCNSTACWRGPASR
jgi:predicted alpha/beta-fold hydrolase